MKARTVVFALLTLCYPPLVWWTVTRGYGEWTAVILAAAVLLQLKNRKSAVVWIIAGGAAVLAAAVLATGEALPAKFYPVMVSAAWLAFFAGSLAGTPAVERFARMKTPDLPPSAVRYCRRVTVAWCVFFLANGTVALDSALNRSDAWWALYNGLISYIAMGLMFAGEYAVRIWVRRNQR